MDRVLSDLQPGLGTTAIVGELTLTKTGTTARTATFPDAAITVAGADYANNFTGTQTFDVIKTQHCDAATSAGVHIGNASHQDVAIFGAGGGQGSTFYGQINGTTLSMSGQITSTVATGSSPFVVASTTKVANLNVDYLNGATWAAPGAIGGTTPAAGAFTTLTASDLIKGYNLEIGDSSTYIGKFTLSGSGGGRFELGSFSNKPVAFVANGSVAGMMNVDGSLSWDYGISCTTLTANGLAIVGASAANGIPLLQDNTGASDHWITLGKTYSDACPVLGYGVGPSPSSATAFVSTTAYNINRYALTFSYAGGLRFYSAAAQTTAIGSVVTMTQAMEVSPAGAATFAGSVSCTTLTQQGYFADIHVHDASTAQTITTGATYTKSTAFTDNGFSANCTPDAANDKITITKTGLYRVEGTCSFTTNTNNVVVKGTLFVGGTEQDQVHWERKIGTSTDIGNAGFTGIIDVTSANTDIDLRLAHDYGSDITVTIKYANLNVSYLGET